MENIRIVYIHIYPYIYTYISIYTYNIHTALFTWNNYSQISLKSCSRSGHFLNLWHSLNEFRYQNCYSMGCTSKCTHIVSSMHFWQFSFCFCLISCSLKYYLQESEMYSYSQFWVDTGHATEHFHTVLLYPV